MEKTVTAKRRFLAVCVWMVAVRSVLGQHGTCNLIANTSSLSCPCFPTAAQSLHLRNIAGSFRDVCTMGEGNGLCCRKATQARVEADRVILNYSWVIPCTKNIFCEIGLGISGVECPSHVTSRKPVFNETDGRQVWDTTMSAHMQIVIPVVLLVGVIILVGLVLILWRRCQEMCQRMSAWMEMHRVPTYSEIPLSAVTIPQAARPSGLPSASDAPEESAPTCPITPHDQSSTTQSRQHHSVSPRLSLQCDPSLPVVQSAELYTVIPVQSDQYLVKL